ncbi:MAG TPA: PAS domain S-box protein [Caulobacteraceae bacterium]
MAEDFWTHQPLGEEGAGAPNWAVLAEQVAGLGYWRLDVATRAIAWSDGLFALYGLRVGQLPDLDSAMAAIHPEDSERANRLLETAMRLGEDYTDQVRLMRADGSWRVLMNRSMCKRDSAGAVTTVFGVVMDVTDMELANDALRASEARYRLMAENGNDLIVQIDLGGRITYISPAAQSVTGFAPEELIGRPVGEFVDPEDKAGLDLAVQESFEQPGRRARCVEYRVRHKDGRVLWLEARPTPLLDARSGKAVGITDVVRDITERKALEAELLAKCDEAEAASRAKAEFLANMSHEIRTPLTAIMGFSGLLSGLGDLPGDASAYVRRICTAGEQLLGVVNDVLDFSRLDAGQVELNPQPLDPAAFLAETLDLLGGQAEAKGLRLEGRVAPGTPRWVSLDGGRVRQVLLNLVGNAIKFTPSGSVTVTLARHGGQALKLAVTDTGGGIAPELQGRLFERFSQVDGSISRHHGGAGLGLAICKGLVELMGGSIGVQSAPGRGSTFWFTLAAPRVAEPQPAPEAPLSAPSASIHVLLVDDVPVNRQLVRAMLEPLGHSFEEAASGAEAVKTAMRRPFDLILMDLQMPGMDGLEAARTIRSTAEVNRDTPIIALSANVLAEQIADCHAAGMNDHLAKPIVPAALVAMVAKWSVSRDASLAA